MKVKVKLTELCKIAYKYGTDKCPQLKHSYTPYYYDLFKDKRKKIKKVLEMGIGGNTHDWSKTDWIYDPKLNRNYHKGASLYMWRDFFPNAQIYGADNAPETIFQDKRIKTFLCDERKKEDIENLVKQTGSDIDLFIDDGSHYWKNQAFLARTILPLLDKGVIYIIEDVEYSQHIRRILKDYRIHIPKLKYTYIKVTGHYFKDGKKGIRGKIPKDKIMMVRKT